MTSQPKSPRLQLLQEKGGWIQIILSQEVQISTCFTIAEICKKHTSISLSIEWNLLLLGTTSFVDSLLHVFWQMRKKKTTAIFAGVLLCLVVRFKEGIPEEFNIDTQHCHIFYEVTFSKNMTFHNIFAKISRV